VSGSAMLASEGTGSSCAGATAAAALPSCCCAAPPSLPCASQRPRKHPAVRAGANKPQLRVHQHSCWERHGRGAGMNLMVWRPCLLSRPVHPWCQLQRHSSLTWWAPSAGTSLPLAGLGGCRGDPGRLISSSSKKSLVVEAASSSPGATGRSKPRGVAWEDRGVTSFCRAASAVWAAWGRAPRAR
jgi:hypothetical protein